MPPPLLQQVGTPDAAHIVKQQNLNVQQELEVLQALKVLQALMIPGKIGDRLLKEKTNKHPHTMLANGNPRITNRIGDRLHLIKTKVLKVHGKDGISLILRLQLKVGRSLRNRLGGLRLLRHGRNGSSRILQVGTPYAAHFIILLNSQVSSRVCRCRTAVINSTVNSCFAVPRV